MPILTDWVEKTEGLSFTVPNSGTTALIKYDHDMESGGILQKTPIIERRLRSPRKLFQPENHFRIVVRPEERSVLLSGSTPSSPSCTMDISKR